MTFDPALVFTADDGWYLHDPVAEKAVRDLAAEREQQAAADEAEDYRWGQPA